VVYDERRVRHFIGVIMASSLIPLALGWYQRFTGGGYFFLGFVGTEFAFRPQGTFAHPAGLGTYLIVLLTLAIGLYFTAVSTPAKAVLLAWAGVAAGCLVLTLARTQWLGMVVAAMVIGLLKQRRLALLALLVAAILLATVPLLRERLSASDSVTWRVELWQAGVSLAWPPTLLGRGLATSNWYVNQLLPTMDVPPHNDYLKVAIEMGVLGVLTFGLWIVSLVRHAWRAYRRASTPAIAWRALGLLAIVIAIVVMSLTDNQLGHTAVQWYFWAVVALVPLNGRWPPVWAPVVPDRAGQLCDAQG
jgi:O-antigen ligase